MQTAVLIDIGNLRYCIKKQFNGRRLDLRKYLEFATGDNELVRAFAYGTELATDPAFGFKTALMHMGFTPKFNLLRPPKDDKDCTSISWNVGIAVDAFNLIESKKISRIVLGSADPGMQYLGHYLQSKQIRCEVIACGISKELKNSCDKFIELTDNFLLPAGVESEAATVS